MPISKLLQFLSIFERELFSVMFFTHTNLRGGFVTVTQNFRCQGKAPWKSKSVNKNLISREKKTDA